MERHGRRPVIALLALHALLGAAGIALGAKLGRRAFALGAILASMAWFSLLGFGGRVLVPVFQKPRAWRVLDGAMAVFMLALAVRLISQPIG